MAIAEQDKVKKKWGENIEAFIDPIAAFFAFVTIAMIAIVYINGQWQFINNTDLLASIMQWREWAIILTVSVKGAEFILKRNSLLLLVIYGALVAVVIIFSFLPDVRNNLIEKLGSGEAAALISLIA